MQKKMKSLFTLFVYLEFLCWSFGISSNFTCDNFYRNRCYEVISSRTTANEAANNCIKKGGILAIIKDQETQDFLLTLLKKESTYWIGLRIIFGIGTFSDGSPLLYGSFTPWEPRSKVFATSDSEDYCVYLNTQDKSWNQISCRRSFAEKAYICETEARECSVQDAQILNGKIECPESISLQPFEELHVQCNNGFYLNGSLTIKCLPSGKWENSTICLPGCKTPVVPESTTLLNPRIGYKTGQTARLLCEDGFFEVEGEMKNSFDIVCQDDATWSKAFPDCHKVQDEQRILIIPLSIEVLVNNQNEVTLNCTNSTTFTSIIWMKLQEKIMRNNPKYHIDSQTGSLTIRQFSLQDEGLYSCILKNNRNISFFSYNLKINISNKCVEVETNHLSVDRNEDIFLQCGNISSTEIRWYKDQHRIWGTSRQIILPDGNLIIKKVQKSDEGEYKCSMKHHALQCIQEFKISLILHSHPELQCGINENELEIPSWLVSLWYPTDVVPFCYGTLIDDKWILTTASCVSESHRKRNPDFYVKLTLHKPGLIDVPIPNINVSKVKIHPQYSPRLRSNDIALVLLNTSATNNFNKETKISPICLPAEPNYLCQGDIVTEGYVSGLGPLNSEDIYPRRERISIVPSKLCNSNSNRIFCATANITSKENIFAGDNGSPFEVELNGRWFLWGIFNYGERATDNGNIDYFTNTKYFIHWINSVREK